MSTKPTSSSRSFFFSTCSNSGDYCIWPSTAMRSLVESGGVVAIAGASSSASLQSSTPQTPSRSSPRSPSSFDSSHSASSGSHTLFSSQMTSTTQSQLGSSAQMTYKPAQQSPNALTAASVTTKSQSDTPPVSTEPTKPSSTQYSTIVLTVAAGTLTESNFNTVSLDSASKKSSNKESSSSRSQVTSSRYTETSPFFTTTSTLHTPTTYRSTNSYESGSVIGTAKHSSTSAVATPSLNATELSTHISKSSVVSKAVPISLSLTFIIGVLLAFAFRRFRKRKGRHPTSKQSNHSSLISFFPPQYPPSLPPPPRPPRPEAPGSPTKLSSKTGLNSFSAIELAAVGGRRSGNHIDTNSVPMKDLNQSVIERSDQSGLEVWNGSELSGGTMVDNRQSSPQNIALGQGYMYPHYGKRSYPQRIQEIPKYIASGAAVTSDGQQVQSGAISYDQVHITSFGSHSPPISMAPLPLHIAKQASTSRSSATSSDGNTAPPRGPLSSRSYILSQSPRPSIPQHADHRPDADNISPARSSQEHVARERFRTLNALENPHEEENRAGDYSPSLYSEDGAGKMVSDLELMGSEGKQGCGSSARAHEEHVKSGAGWM